MENLFPVIRNAVRAVIIKDKRVLLLRKDGGSRGERFALPGGAQDTGETLEIALQRECLEEIGTEVQIEALVYVADYFKERDTTPPSHKHLVEFLFRCRVPKGYIPATGHHPDKHQVAVVWKPLSELDSIELYPRSIISCLQNLQAPPGGAAAYLGLID
ncbi:MAG: NUDIX domain-containing protein [Gammaproteobacteria bacterium]|nr:NUDIX domain-containing protein [Gammaproteobacteria bacterium]